MSCINIVFKEAKVKGLGEEYNTPQFLMINFQYNLDDQYVVLPTSHRSYIHSLIIPGNSKRLTTFSIKSQSILDIQFNTTELGIKHIHEAKNLLGC